ncbi:flagellar basal-body rod protein FlgF [Desulfoscipio geothermicus]|uniref:Flagellar basal-body rod protein FlgG n=1 Tax=Desulfoscipio geothermicus DSM 3669 TaxID=1121426 RepID=A0A1I6CVC2_9FIRM|nr:flagellar basal-body rod protein FlgF [Desulfoscipio geothermicus]SFQ97136.1 flagellar basal-body rod protein FlgG [Desulfoscipio geothermicus DSM 3669]
MIRGIYTTVSGMNVQIARMDTLSNNLANINTPGFKKDRTLAEPFTSLLQLSIRQTGAVSPNNGRVPLGSTNLGASVKQVATDFSPGLLRETGNNTDFALSRPGFFVLADPENEDDIYYTRSGNFHLDENGFLVNDGGYRVIGENGPLQISDSEKFTVDENGSITENENVTGKFYIASFNDPGSLERIGSNLYRAREQEPEQVADPGLMQRFLEGSNVEPVEEMMHMINVARAYETGQKIIQSQDGLLDLAINKVGVVR